MKPRERIIRLLLRILANPRLYTRRDLADHFDSNIKTIGKELKILDDLDEINVKYQLPQYTYYIEPNNRYTELSALHPLTEEERLLVARAVHAQSGSTAKAERLVKKIAGLYDYQQLGLQALRHPAIERINRLEDAKKRRKQVILVNYRSNNNSIENRRAEPFRIDTEHDILHAYSYKNGETRHFRLSRIERIEVTEDAWQNENKHVNQYTDVFRISNDDSVTVKLQLTVRAYNLLIEQYPPAAGKTEPSGEKGFFVFQDKVNRKFMGITDFIMGQCRDVEILAPDSLRTHIRERATALAKKLEE